LRVNMTKRRRPTSIALPSDVTSSYAPPGYVYARIVRDGLEVRLEFRPSAATGIESREICELENALELSDQQLRTWAAAMFAIDLSSAEQLEIVDL
jgi:hypothetical protein